MLRTTTSSYNSTIPSHLHLSFVAYAVIPFIRTPSTFIFKHITIRHPRYHQCIIYVLFLQYFNPHHYKTISIILQSRALKFNWNTVFVKNFVGALSLLRFAPLSMNLRAPAVCLCCAWTHLGWSRNDTLGNLAKTNSAWTSHLHPFQGQDTEMSIEAMCSQSLNTSFTLQL